MRVVAKEHLASIARGCLRHLVSRMTDEIDVGIPPLEAHPVISIPGVDVGDREPTERLPRFLRKRLGNTIRWLADPLWT